MFAFEVFLESMYNILLVDDDFDLRHTVAEVLGEQGYRVVCAANGREALGLLATEPTPSLILLDMSMPIMNGQDFRSAQRTVPTWAAVPTIVFTGSQDAQKTADDLGAAGVLTKPVDIRHLLRTVKQFVGR